MKSLKDYIDAVLAEGEAPLSEGMWVVKSLDGVEKRFKDRNSDEAKAWAQSTRQKPKVDREAVKAARVAANEKAVNVCSMALMHGDGWGEIDRVDVIKSKILPVLVKSYNQDPDSFSDDFYEALREAKHQYGSFDRLMKYLNAGAKKQGYSSFDRYANEMERYTGESVEENTDDQAYLDQRVADYEAEAGAGLQQGEYTLYGRKFQTYVFDTEDAANAFMSENSGWGMLGYDAEGKIHLAKMDDEGQANESVVTKDQSQDFKDDILAKDEEGNEYDKGYLDQLRRLAGLK